MNAGEMRATPGRPLRHCLPRLGRYVSAILIATALGGSSAATLIGCGEEEEQQYGPRFRILEVEDTVLSSCGEPIGANLSCATASCGIGFPLVVPGCVPLYCAGGPVVNLYFGTRAKLEFILPGDPVPESGYLTFHPAGGATPCVCTNTMDGKWTVLARRGDGLSKPPFATPDFYMKLQFETLPSPAGSPCPYEGSLKAIIEYTWEKYSD